MVDQTNSALIVSLSGGDSGTGNGEASKMYGCELKGEVSHALSTLFADATVLHVRHSLELELPSEISVPDSLCLALAPVFQPQLFD